MVCIWLLCLFGGCVPVELLPNGSNGGGDSIPDDGGGSVPDQVVPRVVLTVSNPTPHVNEEVLLSCTVLAGASPATTFAFQPTDGRLLAGSSSGTATFLVGESDIGVAHAYTCTATNEAGTSEPSNVQTIFPG